MVADFAAIYKIDLGHPDAWQGPAAPFRAQILALTNQPGALRRALGGD